MRLIELVERYASEAHHRSGTESETRTCDWLVAELEARGLATRRIGFEFSRFDADWALQLDGLSVEAIPLFYCAEGEFDLRGAGLHRLLPDHWEEAATLHRIATLVEAERGRGGHALVLATDTIDGRVSAINVASSDNLDFPVLLFGARDRARAANVSGYLRAQRRPARSTSIVARSKHPVELILTTSYTGWFGCAAERGAGLAILLQLVSRLAARVGLAVVLTSGHEHHHLGGHAVRAQESFPPAAPVLHLGSCLASSSGTCRVTDNCGLDAAKIGFDASRFDPRGVAMNASPSEWAGEAADWINGRRPVLSLSGIDDHFHTPADTADALDPRQIDAMLDAVERAAMAIFDAGAATIARQE